MCGIVGAVAERDVVPILLEGLKRLEYRGYDSAGIAVLNEQGKFQRVRMEGKVHRLIEALAEQKVSGHIGIAHTRWATHGSPCERNAHPHVSGEEIILVHNGIIENFESLRSNLKSQGYHFTTDTDTEVVAHMINATMGQGHSFLKAVQITCQELQGAFALAIQYINEPNKLIVVRRGSPLVIGLGIGEHFIASDSLALLPVARNFIYLEEGDIAEVSREAITIYDVSGTQVERFIKRSELNADAADKGQYRHFMLKEIFEQSDALHSTIEGRLSHSKVLDEAFGHKAAAIFNQVQSVQIVACGTSYHAGLIARYWLEEYAGIPCHVEVASEFRYRKKAVIDGTLFVCISQSGETADTLAALCQAKELNYLATLAISNVAESSIVREADITLLTRAGVEIGVASTKAFTTQLAGLLLLVAVIGRRHQLSLELEAELVSQLNHLPSLVKEIFKLDAEIKELAHLFSNRHHALFLGRGAQFPVALEGALKLKEISYIHAEAYPAGELKHGPLALIDEDMPVVAVAPNDELLEKLKANLEVVRARGGQLYVFADETLGLESTQGTMIIKMPKVTKLIAPIAYTIPLQLLAYYVAVVKGTDVDQPRNLAKSVTVE